MTTYEKTVKGATKPKVAAPKAKYLEPILMATLVTQDSSNILSTIMKCLDRRLQDSSWLVVYKSLIVIHIMIREGDKDVMLDYLASNAHGMLNLSHSNVAKNSGFNSEVRYIMKYSRYLQTRVRQFFETSVDYVRDERLNNTVGQGGGRLRTLTVEKGLLRECESVQKQIDALLKNSFLELDIKNDVVLTAFRLLVNDLLALFQELNEGVINLLEHYFEMFKDDATRSLEVYKKFVDQTKYVIDYLRVAKHLEYATKLHVPTIKHAPTALTSSLEEYLNDPQFDRHREGYLIKKSPRKISTPDKFTKPALAAGSQNASHGPSQVPTASLAASRGSNGIALELNRANLLLVAQSTYNPWGSVAGNTALIYGIVPTFTGAGFGGYGRNEQQQQAQELQHQTQQLQQQQTQQFQQFQQLEQQQLQQQQFQQQQFQQQQFQQQEFHLQPFQQQQPQQQLLQMRTSYNGSNPFLNHPQNTHSLSTGTFNGMINTNLTGAIGGLNGGLQGGSSALPGLQRANTNPFALQAARTNSNPFGATRFSLSGTTAFTFSHPGAEKINPALTGRNPFKVSETTTAMFNSILPQQAQPLKVEPTAGGLENLPTVPVFPQTQQAHIQNAYLESANANLISQATGQLQQQQQQQFRQYPAQNQRFQEPLYVAYNGPSLI